MVRTLCTLFHYFKSYHVWVSPINEPIVQLITSEKPCFRAPESVFTRSFHFSHPHTKEKKNGLAMQGYLPLTTLRLQQFFPILFTFSYCCTTNIPIIQWFCLHHYIYVTRFYKTDPNRTSRKIKLTPPMDSHTIFRFSILFGGKLCKQLQVLEVV